MSTQGSEPMLTYRSVGQAGRAAVTATFPDGRQFVDKLDATSAKARQAFVDRCLEGHPELSRDALAAEVDRIGAEVAAEPSDDDADTSPDADGADGRTQGTPLRDQLLELRSDLDLFHSPGREESVAYATVMTGGTFETLRVESKRFRWRLYGEFRKKTGISPPTKALDEAIQAFIGIALFEGPEREVAIRVGEHDGAIFIDLANPAGEVIRVDKLGYEEISSEKCPVRFLRTRGMESLPRPCTNWSGGLAEFRELINIGDELQFDLLLAFMVACLYPRGPYPILVVHGEQGSGKSFLVRVLRAVIDPFKPAMRRPPREDRDLMIAAGNARLLCYDNLSGLSPWLSDSMCSLATGGGFATRELYTNNEEILFEATRPIIVNGIEEIASRSDFLDRAIILHLPVIPEDKRRDEADLLAKFERIRPVVFHRMIYALSAILRRRDYVRLPSKPRLADFALIATAAEGSLGMEDGEFMRAFTGNRRDTNEVALEGSPLGPAVQAFMEGRESWEGTSADLLDLLEKGFTDEKCRNRRDWPRTPRALRGALERVAPNLRLIGLDVAFGQHGDGRKRGRLIVIRALRKQQSAPSAPSEVAGTGPGSAAMALPDGLSADDQVAGPVADRPDQNGRDGADGQLQRPQASIPQLSASPTISELESHLAYHAKFLDREPRDFIEDIFDCDLDEETLTEAGLRHLAKIVEYLGGQARGSDA